MSGNLVLYCCLHDTPSKSIIVSMWLYNNTACQLSILETCILSPDQWTLCAVKRGAVPPTWAACTLLFIQQKALGLGWLIHTQQAGDSGGLLPTQRCTVLPLSKARVGLEKEGKEKVEEGHERGKRERRILYTKYSLILYSWDNGYICDLESAV